MRLRCVEAVARLNRAYHSEPTTEILAAAKKLAEWVAEPDPLAAKATLAEARTVLGLPEKKK